MPLRAEALEWLRTNFGVGGGAVYCSRLYAAVGSPVAEESWWHAVPLSRLRDRRVRYIRLLCRRADLGFEYLRVPKQRLAEEMKNLLVDRRSIHLHLSAVSPHLFTDLGGRGRVQFAEYLVQPDGPGVQEISGGRSSPPRYTVYVIELSADAAVPNPAGLRPLYVGQTAHTPEHRFEQHRAGGLTAASKPHLYGVKLRPDLYAHLAPFPSRPQAEAAEALLAAHLEQRGHRVFWG
jgi:hypothetical protein